MKILLKSATIVDKNSKHHLQTKDVLIKNGTIKKIENNINDNADKIIEIKNLHISNGWFDTSVSLGEPGFEERETIENGVKVAQKSGFTTIAIQPNTNPVIDDKTGIEYILQQVKNINIKLIPIGALTNKSEGKELAELYDMQNSGALAFGDYNKAIENANLMKIALQYAQNIDALILSFPQHNQLANGSANESINSTKIGLKGNPNLAESLQISRDLYLLEYTGGKLHIPCISTKESVDLIADAKKKGLKVTCSVSINHLAFTDDKILDFNTNSKILPPLRTEKDRLALIKGVKNGTIDIITSNHNPIDIEHKKVPFEQALYGSIGLESFFGLANKILDLDVLIECITTKPKSIFGIENTSIDIEKKANLTLFNPKENYTFTKKDILSTSKNAIALNKDLKGKVYGVIVGKNLIIN
jgi:dihydroorotase